METTTLHIEKVKILSRLVKADAISLEEALLLLETEETPTIRSTSSNTYGVPVYTNGGTATITTPATGIFPIGSCFNTFSTTTNTSKESAQIILDSLIKETQEDATI